MSIHESGHAVLAVVQGLGIKYVRLKPKPEVSLNNRLDRITNRYPSGEIFRFLLGGFLAERRFYPKLCDCRNSAHDFKAAFLMLPEEEEEQWLRFRTEADLLVARYQLAIRTVADELLRRGRLNALLIAKIIRKSSR